MGGFERIFDRFAAADIHHASPSRAPYLFFGGLDNWHRFTLALNISQITDNPPVCKGLFLFDTRPPFR